MVMMNQVLTISERKNRSLINFNTSSPNRELFVKEDIHEIARKLGMTPKVVKVDKK